MVHIIREKIVFASIRLRMTKITQFWSESGALFLCVGIWWKDYEEGSSSGARRVIFSFKILVPVNDRITFIDKH